MNNMDNLEKQLICPICLEMFTKPVVILPCQHNLPTRAGSLTSGGRFRCPSCRHEVVLDRHGVYGLQRNLLVENIIDMFKQESSSGKPVEERKEQMPMCDVHEGEKINIYCITHAVPTCSMCKIFGAHKDCEVSPITSIYQTKKMELSDGIAMMVGNNDRMQGIISQLEETCRAIEISLILLCVDNRPPPPSVRLKENGRRQKTMVCEKFDQLYSVLEEKKREMSQKVTDEQEEKLSYIRSLTRKYGDHLEQSCKVVEMGIQNMEEPEMALFLQNTKPLLKKITDATSTAHLDKVERGYENMDHFHVEFKKVGQALRSIDFIQEEEEEEHDDEEGEAEDEEAAQTVSEGSAVPTASLQPPEPQQTNPSTVTSATSS